MERVRIPNTAIYRSTELTPDDWDHLIMEAWQRVMGVRGRVTIPNAPFGDLVLLSNIRRLRIDRPEIVGRISLRLETKGIFFLVRDGLTRRETVNPPKAFCEDFDIFGRSFADLIGFPEEGGVFSARMHYDIIKSTKDLDEQCVVTRVEAHPEVSIPAALAKTGCKPIWFLDWLMRQTAQWADAARNRADILESLARTTQVEHDQIYDLADILQSRGVP